MADLDSMLLLLVCWRRCFFVALLRQLHQSKSNIYLLLFQIISPQVIPFNIHLFLRYLRAKLLCMMFLVSLLYGCVITNCKLGLVEYILFLTIFVSLTNVSVSQKQNLPLMPVSSNTSLHKYNNLSVAISDSTLSCTRKYLYFF